MLPWRNVVISKSVCKTFSGKILKLLWSKLKERSNLSVMKIVDIIISVEPNPFFFFQVISYENSYGT